METFTFAINAILPILLLVVIGYILKSKHFLDESWFKKGNKLIFRVCLPTMLFINVYNIKSLSQINWSVVLYSEIAILLLFMLGILLVRCFVPDNRQKGVVLQCVFRSNFAIIGLPLADALGGAEGVGIAAVLSAFSIPTFNILAVVSLTMFREENGEKIKPKDMLKKIVTNPLIIGVALGLVVLVLRSVMPAGTDGTPVFTLKDDVPFLYETLNNIAKICSPLALLICGGLFNFSAIKSRKRPIAIGVLARVVITPLVAIGVVVLLSRYTSLLELGNGAYPALLALFGSPVAVSSAIMAQEMDNDGVLAGQLVVWTSVASVVTLFAFILALRNMGLM